MSEPVPEAAPVLVLRLRRILLRVQVQVFLEAVGGREKKLRLRWCELLRKLDLDFQ
jgi:hypothetical protein